MDDDEVEREYERARQEQIKQNKDLLASLGLNAQTTRIRSPSPPGRASKSRAKATHAAKIERDGSTDGSRNGEPSREKSQRVAARGRRSYLEKDFYKTEPAVKRGPKLRQPRSGTRKSSRLSGERPFAGLGSADNSRRYVEASTSDTDSDDYVGGSRSNGAKRHRRGPPAPPAKVNGRDWNDETDIYPERMPLPGRDEDSRELIFEDEYDYFVPSLTPEEVMRGGAFGGTYFRPHFSSVLQRDLDPEQELAELPQEWLRGIDREKMLTSEDYNMSINRYGKKAGQSLAEWEQAGWIVPADPRGWFQWYIRFYLGRRTRDDVRQISRWNKAVGPTGRFRRSAETSVASRQICWQWAVDPGY
ncbi:unnamed protein product [Parajaminaea phylloscopi]